MRAFIVVALVFAAGLYTGTHAKEMLHELEAIEQTIEHLGDPSPLMSHPDRYSSASSESPRNTEPVPHVSKEWMPQPQSEQVKRFDLRDHFAYLKQFHPNLNRSDLERICHADLVELYYKAYRAQGFERNLARAKAEIAVVEE